jgi:hypothetical protein
MVLLPWMVGKGAPPTTLRALEGIAKTLFKRVDAADEAPPVSEWPQWVRDAMLNPFKQGLGRYKLMQFLYRNTFTAHTMELILSWWNVPNNPGYRVMQALIPRMTKRYDNSAMRDLSDFIAAVHVQRDTGRETQQLRRMNDHGIFNFIAGKVI